MTSTPETVTVTIRMKLGTYSATVTVVDGLESQVRCVHNAAGWAVHGAMAAAGFPLQLLAETEQKEEVEG